MEINNISEGLLYVLSYLQKVKDKNIKNYVPVPGEFGIKAYIINTQELDSYFYTLNKTLFTSFWYLDEGLRINGFGIGHDKKSLDYCHETNTKPILLFKNGTIYTLPAENWLYWCELHRKDNNFIISKPNDRGTNHDQNIYYNIPLKLLKNFKNE